MVEEMFDLMYEHEGVGLAAPQVDLPYRLFVINPEGDPDVPEAERVFINPVLSAGKGHEEGREGCLSLPGLYAQVPRNTSVRVNAYDLSGNELDLTLSGFDARVVQHEADHLDGTLFIDRLPPASLAALRDDLEEFELDWQGRRASGGAPSDDAIAARLAELEKLRA